MLDKEENHAIIKSFLTATRSSMNRGLVYGILAYLLWGILPLYWKALQAVPAPEILVNRIIWSFVFLFILLSIRRQWDWFQVLLRDRRRIGFLAGCAALIASNWYVYIWAVNAGYVVETSLGYFINPLVNVFLGVLILHERMRPGQWAAIAVATGGVLFLTLTYGSLPWIALFLAFSFGFYGLLKKKARFGSVEGLATEMAFLLLPALIGFFVFQTSGQPAILSYGWTIIFLLMGSGVVTAVPLLLFAEAVQRVALSTIGLLQYIAPTIQFLLGIYVFNEPFTTTRLIGFIMIWVALIIYSVEGILMRRIASAPISAD
jgi:chloramphenicol-sensitive protein RarD